MFFEQIFLPSIGLTVHEGLRGGGGKGLMKNKLTLVGDSSTDRRNTK